MPLPIPAPNSNALIAAHAAWQAHLDTRVASLPPPPGRAACEASVRAAERAMLGPRRVPVW